MENSVIEASYPLSFRESDAKKLGEYLRQRHSVDLVGMKRVGISNFLRFFLYHKDIVKTYINGDETHLFIPVDLNDLIERELFPFWALTFKRLVDVIEHVSIDKKIKAQASKLFVDAIQSQDVFLTLDVIRQMVVALGNSGVYPTFFFLRFDRLKDAATPEFFDNLQGLRDATGHKLCYVFTSFRTLDRLVPTVFKKESLSVFTQSMYVKPASDTDIMVIFDTFEKRYQLKVDKNTTQTIVKLSGGHVQYLQLSLIILKELLSRIKLQEDIKSIIFSDERITLQSDELWESLDEAEKEILMRIIKKEDTHEEDKMKGKYLWDSGFVKEHEGKTTVFSPIFEYYLEEKVKHLSNGQSVELTKKENALFNFLKENLNTLCERERIIETVWPEYEELGVSDWAVDRLVARVRAKLENGKSEYKIVTIKTRGYKLVSE